MTKEELDAGHAYASQHRAMVEASAACSCFFCMSSFPPGYIKEWCDKGQTAICPRCGIDAVVGDAQLEVTPEWLDEMNRYWFAVASTDGV